MPTVIVPAMVIPIFGGAYSGAYSGVTRNSGAHNCDVVRKAFVSSGR
jgi:hypothetical protein